MKKKVKFQKLLDPGAEAVVNEDCLMEVQIRDGHLHVIEISAEAGEAVCMELAGSRQASSSSRTH